MKFSVEVETESHTYDSPPDRNKEKPSHLQWDIQVEVMQILQKVMEENIDIDSSSCVKISSIAPISVSKNSVTTNSVSKKSVISSTLSESSSLSLRAGAECRSVLTQQANTVIPTKTPTKKISSTSELMARMGKGRKVWVLYLAYTVV